MVNFLRCGIVAAGLLWAAAGAAQIESGQLRLGVGLVAISLEAATAGEKDLKTRQFSLAPGGSLRLGYTLTDKLELGLLGGVSRVELELDSQEETATAWRVGPYAEWNVPLNGERTLFLSPGVSVLHTGTDGAVLDLEGVEIGTSLWVKVFVLERVSLDFGVVVAYFTGEANGNNRLSYFSDAGTDSIRVTPQLALSVWR